jgi:hypothetical protein
MEIQKQLCVLLVIESSLTFSHQKETYQKLSLLTCSSYFKVTEFYNHLKTVVLENSNKKSFCYYLKRVTERFNHERAQCGYFVLCPFEFLPLLILSLLHTAG